MVPMQIAVGGRRRPRSLFSHFLATRSLVEIGALRLVGGTLDWPQIRHNFLEEDHAAV